MHRLNPDIRTWTSYAGVGLKPQHVADILSGMPAIGFFEVHAENYMGEGGSPHRHLEAIRESYPLSVHGVGLSLGGFEALDRAHLARLAAVVRRYEPALVSEHLAWSTHASFFFNDLLPVPYTHEALQCVAEHVDQVQSTLGRTIALENPSTYLAFAESTYSEVDFMAEVAKRTGCTLLLDINNVYVRSVNCGENPLAYIDAFPLRYVQEIHLAGHATQGVVDRAPLLIDSHDRAVCDAVWAIFRRVIDRLGPVPTLIERDANIPAWDVLRHEALQAHAYIDAHVREGSVEIAC